MATIRYNLTMRQDNDFTTTLTVNPAIGDGPDLDYVLAVWERHKQDAPIDSAAAVLDKPTTEEPGIVLTFPRDLTAVLDPAKVYAYQIDGTKDDRKEAVAEGRIYVGAKLAE